MIRLRHVPRTIAMSPLATYLRDINATPLLTAKQEKELAHRIQDGDPEARDHLVRANLRLVVRIALHYNRKGTNLPDLIQEGSLGLLRAAEAFDPTMNTRFSTYATYWIRQAVKRGLHRQLKCVRLPAHVLASLARWQRAATALREELGCLPSEQEVAHRIGLSRRKLRNIRRALRLCNMTLLSDQAESRRSLDEMLVCSRTELPDHALHRAEQTRQVRELLDQLDGRAAAVLRMRFGLDESGPRSLEEIGDFFGVTRERVRQIEKQTLAKLRDAIEGE
jgi:RNA polymerase primary sigma factor